MWVGCSAMEWSRQCIVYHSYKRSKVSMLPAATGFHCHTSIIDRMKPADSVKIERQSKFLFTGYLARNNYSVDLTCNFLAGKLFPLQQSVYTYTSVSVKNACSILNLVVAIHGCCTVTSVPCLHPSSCGCLQHATGSCHRLCACCSHIHTSMMQLAYSPSLCSHGDRLHAHTSVFVCVVDRKRKQAVLLASSCSLSSSLLLQIFPCVSALQPETLCKKIVHESLN